MNYRHAYHAGNFADVMKHAILARVIEYMKRKDKAFRVIDTHAGIGMYDVASPEAQKTGEWRDGIGRIIGAPLDGRVAELLEPYLDAVRAANPELTSGGGLVSYPGSPCIARHLLRKQDRLSALELHPQDAERLRSNFAGDHQTRVIELDGWLAYGSQLPPKEKRGLVLTDPPFELQGEFDRMVEALQRGWRRWPGGTYALWYPIKERAAVGQFRQRLREARIPDMIDAVLEVRSPSPEPRLDGCGMVLVNPPFMLTQELEIILPALARLLAQGNGAVGRIDRLAGETLPPNA